MKRPRRESFAMCERAGYNPAEAALLALPLDFVTLNGFLHMLLN